ncbi:hypothetical protein SARC_05789 [Sphaeroforma arctica JP610]|uniref:Palmitoyltransferase n=1 Tax=Sphaeroforma arctica JP610 TaxID=667725 RepID=A0A0L0FZC9_9EUKA|nr:hypothetical protein SARC_05789 [Sphaeroforma arctica JP610]KNC81916.1 hypothetical protein SARC_05789 [Sphaeroforma arctica JP610]|eukprot:XP_014155818.1 hypothetical protein SARC_05789 [Sphaeroforma arctica JP610]
MKCPKIVHWGPLVTICLIAFHTLGTEIVLYRTWRDHEQPVYHSIVHMGLAFMLVLSYLCSMYLGPGEFPMAWEPADKREQLQYCYQCERFKPPRAHHCRECGTCCPKMDHHCPWINGCVGWKNQKAFVLFLLYVVLDGFHSMYIIGWRAYLLVHFGLVWRQPMLFADVFLVGSVAFAVWLAVGVLLFFQLRIVLRNRSDIEAWIMLKADDRRQPEEEPFAFPYTLSRRANFAAVFGPSPLWWFIPTASHGNGLWWDVVEGCDQYTLTREQLAQKRAKRKEAQLMRVTQPFNRGWFGCGWGHQTWRTHPSMDDERLAVEVSDLLLITRDKKHWLYGEKLTSEGEDLSMADRAKAHGWMPRTCAQELDTHSDEYAELAGEYFQLTTKPVQAVGKSTIDEETNADMEAETKKNL